MLNKTVTASSSVVTPSNRQSPVCLSQRYLRSPCAKECWPPVQLNMKYRAFCQFSCPPTASQSLSIRSCSAPEGTTCPFTAVVQHHSASRRFSLSLTERCIIFIILIFQQGTCMCDMLKMRKVLMTAKGITYMTDSNNYRSRFVFGYVL